MLSQMSGLPSLWLNNIPLCVCVWVCPASLHPSVDRSLGRLHILVIVNDVDSVQLLAMIGPIIISYIAIAYITGYSCSSVSYCCSGSLQVTPCCWNPLLITARTCSVPLSMPEPLSCRSVPRGPCPLCLGALPVVTWIVLHMFLVAGHSLLP